jgi:hypothetical protein
MPKLAKSIAIGRRGLSEFSLKIDGEEFGFYIAREPITTTTDVDDLGRVTFTVLAEKVTIEDDSSWRNHHGGTTLGPDEARDVLRKMNATDGQTSEGK